jgi:L-threonylcarbamoyladenylate synthase
METRTVPLRSGLDATLTTLSEGGVVVFPSANTYGLLANAESHDAADQIYELKDRDRTKPLGYLSNRRRAPEVGIISEQAARALSLWPSPLSVIVPKTARVPAYITRLPSILLVCPDERCIELVDRAPFLIACTSANPAGSPPVNDFHEACITFDGRVPLIVDGGQSKYGASGTMIDLSRTAPTILRRGPYPVDALKEIFHDLVVAEEVL